ncbi:hypothetical protein DPEC_G00379750 [Dallia pectoralis]|nr:hypothetical protein DPEC_G00379750 [Dallia pectoralis]
MECLYVPALVLYCFCLLSVKFVSPSVSVISHPGLGDVNKRKEPEQCHQGEDDVRDMDFLPLVGFLGGVTAVLLTVIIILALKIRCDTNRLNSVADLEKTPQIDLDQDPDALNYASLSFTSKKEKKKMLKRREAELDPNVVYATTR